MMATVFRHPFLEGRPDYFVEINNMYYWCSLSEETSGPLSDPLTISSSGVAIPIEVSISDIYCTYPVEVIGSSFAKAGDVEYKNEERW